MKLGKMLGTTKMFPKMSVGKLAGISTRDLGISSFGTKRRGWGSKSSLRKMLRDV
jgi:hypothetical protein